MAKKTALFGGRTVKVENRSAFDKSHLNMLTTGVGTITPILKQLVIPSSGRCKIPVHVELPPLAADAYLRTHLKLEAFFCPLRLCYGGFQSWFSGEPVWDVDGETYDRAQLPRAFVVSKVTEQGAEPATDQIDPNDARDAFGPGSLTDYFDVRFLSDSSTTSIPSYEGNLQFNGGDYEGTALNLFPYVAYHLIYDHFFRNKSVSRPAFIPFGMGARGDGVQGDIASHLPYMSCIRIIDVLLGSELDFEDGAISGLDTIGDIVSSPYLDNISTDRLLNGYSLFQLRQRNFGDDYFTAAKPDAQSGAARYVQTDANGRFTISAIRAQNALQEFEENQNYATPDFIQTNMARYGVKLSDGIAQKPILLGSSDFPIYTKSVELNSAAGYTSQGIINGRNPFSANGIIGTKSGVASGNGTFSFDFDVKEPGYIMVMATLCPEANYASGIAKDMRVFISSGSLTDLPVGLLEHIGDEPIFASELTAGAALPTTVFGYVQRYLWHKAGEPNQIHGLFRKGQSLQAFAPQREFEDSETVSTEFLEIPTTALDDVAAVESGVSQYGVMMDCAIELFVSEPLSESALPALVNPASEHGRSIYLSNGGSKLA